MRLVETAVIAAVIASFAGLSFAEQKPRAVTTDSRVLTLQYSATQVYKLRGADNFVQCIEFAPNEIIKKPVMLGDPAAWNITEDGNVLCFKSWLDSASGNMIVATNLRRYSFMLTSLGKVSANDMRVNVSIKFNYPDDVRRASEAAKAIEARHTVSKSETALRNGSYTFKKQGQNAPVPIEIYDDGQFTYFTFDKKKPRPLVFRVGPGGQQMQVNGRAEGNKYVVEVIARQFTLTASEKKEDMTCIFNDGFPVAAPTQLKERN